MSVEPVERTVRKRTREYDSLHTHRTSRVVYSSNSNLNSNSFINLGGFMKLISI